MKVYYSDTSIGTLVLYFKAEGLCHLDLISEKKPPTLAEAYPELESSIKAYFLEGKPLKNMTLFLEGSAFQRSVWEAVMKIPHGETRSYQAIANSIEKPRAIRAVATAIGKNPIPLFIPCHRVLRKDGNKTGFLWGHEIRCLLLGIEKKSS